MSCDTCREEFRLKNFSLATEKAEDFVRGEWNRTLHWVFRVIACGYTCIFLLYSLISKPYDEFSMGNSTDSMPTTSPSPSPNLTEMVDTEPAQKKVYFAYVFLTIWSYTMLALYFLVCFVNLVVSEILHRKQNMVETEPLLSSHSVGDAIVYNGVLKHTIRLQWLLWSIASNAAIIVTFAYFLFLYPMIIRLRGPGITYNDLSVHGFNSVFIVIELMVSAHPIRFLHIIYPFIYASIYCIWSVIFWAIDHTNIIYPVILDWNHPDVTLFFVALLAFVVLPTVQTLLFGAYKLRKHVASRINPEPAMFTNGFLV